MVVVDPATVVVDPETEVVVVVDPNPVVVVVITLEVEKVLVEVLFIHFPHKNGQ